MPGGDDQEHMTNYAPERNGVVRNVNANDKRQTAKDETGIYGGALRLMAVYIHLLHSPTAATAQSSVRHAMRLPILGLVAIIIHASTSAASTTTCHPRAWVRAPDLSPGLVTAAHARLTLNGTGCDVLQWDVGLRMKERAIFKFQYVPAPCFRCLLLRLIGDC